MLTDGLAVRGISACGAFYWVRSRWSLTSDAVACMSKHRSFATLRMTTLWDSLYCEEACAMSFQLGDGGDGETDAAYDEIGRHLVGSEGEQLHGVVEL
jgi:hypothetical protein